MRRGRVRVRAGGSLWAISRPLPGKPFPNEWDFCVEACVPEDRDRFVFGDFVVVIAAFVNGLDDCGELFLRDHGRGTRLSLYTSDGPVLGQERDRRAFAPSLSSLRRHARQATARRKTKY
jgi:hypothetical protein